MIEMEAEKVNEQHLYLKKFKIFENSRNSKCYKLVLEGIFFDKKVKV